MHSVHEKLVMVGRINNNPLAAEPRTGAV